MGFTRTDITDGAYALEFKEDDPSNKVKKQKKQRKKKGQSNENTKVGHKVQYSGSPQIEKTPTYRNKNVNVFGTKT